MSDEQSTSAQLAETQADYQRTQAALAASQADLTRVERDLDDAVKDVQEYREQYKHARDERDLARAELARERHAAVQLNALHRDACQEVALVRAELASACEELELLRRAHRNPRENS